MNPGQRTRKRKEETEQGEEKTEEEEEKMTWDPATISSASQSRRSMNIKARLLTDKQDENTERE